MNQVCTCLSKNNIAINLLFSSKVAAGAIYYFFFFSSIGIHVRSLSTFHHTEGLPSRTIAVHLFGFLDSPLPLAEEVDESDVVQSGEAEK